MGRWSGFLLLLAAVSRATAQTPAPAPNTALVLGIEGLPEEVQFQRRQVTRWDRAYTNLVLDAGDFFRTGPRSRALLRFSNLETFRVDERSTLRIPEDKKPRRALDLIRGAFYFLHRDKPGALEIRTRLVNSVVRGTEFVVEVDEDGTTRLHLIDGVVEMTNDFGGIELKSGESARVDPGQPPVRTAAVNAINVIQWVLYYPGVLNADEMELGAEERDTLRASLEAYRAGDLLGALGAYPPGRNPPSDGETVYLAALLLSVGKVAESEARLATLAAANAANPRQAELADALRNMIATVQNRPRVAAFNPLLSSSFVAESYALQAEFKLEAALAAARRAVEIAPAFAFAQARVADLEFSFGRTRAAAVAIKRSLELGPRNAQAAALQGFLFAAENRFGAAEAWFDRALALDSGLGNAWLGRGLCRIHRGRTQAGLEDLQAAVTVEPQRAVLRSYLGKAFSLARDNRLALHELDLSRQFDARDPTAWLYSALVLQQMNRVNEAARELERSQELSQNRQVYRSRLLLDQDEAVRSANLAQIYADAGMANWSRFEAGRAVSTDYANYSAHLFLANSYDQLRDPRQINLRYETAWLGEYLVANLLAPAGAGMLSPAISQQEYSRLFEQNRLGLISSTEYFSNGSWVERGAQFGVYDNFAYSFDANYRHERGDRPNSDLDLLTLTLQLKQQITAQDGVYFQATYYNAETGDVAPHYYQTNANRGLRTTESEKPLLVAGYHHEWAPGSHTLFLVGRLQDTMNVHNTNFQTLLVERDFNGDVAFVTPRYFTERYENEFVIYTAEAQQIWQNADNTLVAGARFQSGEFDTRDTLTNSRPSIPYATKQSVENDLLRASAYAYYSRQIVPRLQLAAGLTYDYLEYPENFRYAPVVDGEESRSQWSPKAGAVWTPTDSTTLRGAYAKALGGVSFDQSFQLEPTQVAGFNQAFRSIMPEAAVGANTAPEFQIAGLSFEQRLPTGTYIGVSGEAWWSEVKRTVGVVEFAPGFADDSTRQNLDFTETALTVSVNQLIGRDWSLGAVYRLSHADLESQFPQLPLTGGFDPSQHVEATLNQLNLSAIYNHPSGFFGQFESVWMHQRNEGYSPSLPGDDFWQFNVYAGYRFPRRRAELRFGLLNLSGQDYNLNPLNATPYLWRERTFTARLVINF